MIRIWTRVARAYLATFVSASEQAKYAAVSIALAALFVGCFDESSAGCLDLGDASAYFRLEPRVDDRQSRGGGDVLNAVRLVLWHNGHMRDLGTLGGTYGVGNWLNDEGEVVGQSNLAGDQVTRPFLWNGRKMINLGDLGGGFGFANYVNERGDVAGASLAPDGNFHGFRWHEGHMIDLPPVGGAPWAFADSINNGNQVVGNETNVGGSQELTAVLWNGSRGYDLNALVAPNQLQMVSADTSTTAATSSVTACCTTASSACSC